MSKLKPILFGVGGFALVYGIGMAYRQTMLLKNSEFNFKGVKGKSFRQGTIRIILQFEMVNKSNVELYLYNQKFNIFLADEFVGTISDTKAVTIPKKGSQILEYEVVIPPKFALKAGINVLSSGTLEGAMEQKLRIDGSVGVKTFSIFFNRLPINLEFKLSELLNR